MPDESSRLSRRRLLQVAGSGTAASAIGIVGSASASDTEFNGDPYDDPEYPSDEWFAREQANWSRTRQEPLRQANDPGFQKRWQEQGLLNELNHRQRELEETEWELKTNYESVCQRWGLQCTGNPYLYPADEPVWSGDPFYEQTGTVERVVFYDRADEPARVNGRVWAPKDAEPIDGLPGVVLMCGGGANEAMYWWFAQTLVENGYVVLTFDPVGQGRSEESELTHTDNHIDALDFFKSTPENPYPHNENADARDDEDVVPIKDHNPFHHLLDQERIGTAGHSRGARSTCIVQGLDPWPGYGRNPVKAAVSWDRPIPEGDTYNGYAVTPRVPLMGHSCDYRNEEFSSWIPEPKTEPPDPEDRKDGFRSWKQAGLPMFQITIRGGTHFEWSQVPTFAATNWESWGNEVADHYSLAWLDFWLKEQSEPGYDDAEDRLLAENPWHERLSFYYKSAYFFPETPSAQLPLATPEKPPKSWNYSEDLLDE